jgi:competence protein ComEC
MLAFVAGVSCLQQQARLPELQTLAILVLPALGLLIALVVLPGKLRRTRFFTRLPAVRRLCMAFAGASMGFIWAALIAISHLSEELPKELEGQDITLIGTIDSLPHNAQDSVRFNFLIEKSLPDAGLVSRLPSRVALSWYRLNGELSDSLNAGVRPGERWQLTVRMKRPHGNANPMATFDYEVWLLEQGLRATGVVRPAGKYANTLLAPFVWSAGNLIERSRETLRARIHAALPDHRYAGVVVALVVGDQREVGQSDWKIFNRTGIGHLVSISGLHITMVAGLFASLMFYLWRHSFFSDAQLPLRIPAQKVAALGGVLMALIYVALAGFGVPAQRTLYMLTAVALAMWCGRLSSLSQVLCFALGAVVLIDPWAVLWPGFWLSFGAVALLLYVAAGQASRPGCASWRDALSHAWRNACMTQYAISVGLVPLTVLLFSQVSLISPVANAIAIPLISFVVTPLSLLGSVLPDPLSTWLLQLAHGGIALLAQFLECLSGQRFAVWSVAAPSPVIFVVAMLGAFWLLAPRGWPLRCLGLFCFLPLLLNVPEKPNAGEMKVTAFDVGQGMALLVETATHRLLYDTGPYYSPESDAGSRVLLPYFFASGIAQLDTVIVSHNDNDHSGGALSLAGAIEVTELLSSLKPDSPIVRRYPHHRRCLAGQTWDWDGVHFEMLHPSAASYDSIKWKPNAYSCTLKISTDKYSILLPGDIEAAQEKELLNTVPAKLAATVLLAPHHGSGTSSTPEFLKAVHPEVALFQLGYRNRYHHPKAEVFERYADFGVNRLRTDEAGAITLQFGSTLIISEYRTEHARYWYRR